MATGWTASSLYPNMDLHDASLASRVPTPANPTPPPSDVGLINAYSQEPISAATLMTNPTDANDTTLASRKYMNPYTGLRQSVASASVYEQPDAPAFLQQQIANLNAEQTMRRSAQSELLNRLVGGVQSGGPNSYLWTEALRAAAVNPGAHVNFGASVQDPIVGQAYSRQVNSQNTFRDQQTRSLAAANNAQGNIASLFQDRARLGGVLAGGSPTSQQSMLDSQLTNAYMNVLPNSAVQSLGRSVGGSGSGYAGPVGPTRSSSGWFGGF
jgi:hypothetical protein